MSNESIEIGRLWLQLKRIADSLVPQVREPFIGLPGLLGYWPMSIVDFLGNAKDHSGASSDLARIGAPTFNYDGDSYVQCGVATDYLAGSTSAQTVIGTEVWMASGLRGLTLGGWFKIDVVPTLTSGLVTKGGGTPNRGYELILDTSNQPTFTVSIDGTATVQVLGSAIGVASWVFIVGRFTPSSELALFIDQVKTTNTTSIPATINVNAQPFEIARRLNTNTRITECKVRDCFLAASVLSDAAIESVRLATLPS